MLNKQKLKHYIKHLTEFINLKKSDYIALSLISFIFVIFIIISWARWGSPVIDCGKEFYVAEAINNGLRIYTDVFYVYGPLPPVIFSILFLIFGYHINIGYIVGIIVSLLIIIGLIFVYKTLIKSSIILFVMLYICLMLMINPSLFNFIFPYTYSASFSLLLSVIFIGSLILNIKTNNFKYLIAAGITTGIEVITKQDFALAMILVFLFYLALLNPVFNLNYSIKQKLYAFLCFITIPIITFIIILAQSGIDNLLDFKAELVYMFDSEAIRHFSGSLLFGWQRFYKLLPTIPKILIPLAITFLPICLLAYSAELSDKPWRKHFWPVIVPLVFLVIFLTYQLFWEAAFVAVYIVVLYLTFSMSRTPLCSKYIWYSLIPFTFIFLLFIKFFILEVIFMTIYGFVMHTVTFVPVISTCIFIWLLVKKFLFKKDLETIEQFILIISLFTALATLRFYFSLNLIGYGVYYIPLFLAVLFYYLENLSKEENKEFSIRTYIKYYLLGIICTVFTFLTIDFKTAYFNRYVPIKGERGIYITGTNEGETLSKLAYYLKKYVPHNEKIVLLPEESLMYFLLDRKSATRFVDYLPFRLISLEQEKLFINTLKTNKVNFIAISNRSSPDYKYSFWGKDYNTFTYNWIQQNYNLCATYGDYQTEKSFIQGYGIKIYQKKCPVNLMK